MDSSEAIEQGFIPYPYMFPAVQFINARETKMDPIGGKCLMCDDTTIAPHAKSLCDGLWDIDASQVDSGLVRDENDSEVA